MRIALNICTQQSWCIFSAHTQHSYSTASFTPSAGGLSFSSLEVLSAQANTQPLLASVTCSSLKVDAPSSWPAGQLSSLAGPCPSLPEDLCLSWPVGLCPSLPAGPCFSSPVDLWTSSVAGQPSEEEDPSMPAAELVRAPAPAPAPVRARVRAPVSVPVPVRAPARAPAGEPVQAPQLPLPLRHLL